MKYNIIPVSQKVHVSRFKAKLSLAENSEVRRDMYANQ
jgi:hypothetical protein